MRIEYPKKTEVVQSTLCVHLKLTFTKEDINAFHLWAESEALQYQLLSSGLGHHSALWSPEDAEKVQAYIETTGKR